MAEVATIIGFQPVGAYEARQLAGAEQRRVRAAKATKRVLRGLDATVNKLNYSIGHLETELAATRAKIHDRDAREFRSEFGHRTYWFLVAGLLALAMPLDMAAIDFLRLPDSHSFAIALFIGVVTALAAKFTGRVVRQKGWRNQAYRDWALAAAVSVIYACVALAIAGLRHDLGEEAAHKIGAGVDPDMLRDLARQVSAGKGAYLVASLQVMSYVAVVAFSFIHTDPDGDREQLTLLAAVQDKRLQQKWNKRIGVANVHNTELADGELSLADIEHDAIERLAEYRDCNMRLRTEPTPEYFRRPLTRALFHPIDLGKPLDAHPREIGEVIGEPSKEHDNEDE